MLQSKSHLLTFNPGHTKGSLFLNRNFNALQADFSLINLLCLPDYLISALTVPEHPLLDSQLFTSFPRPTSLPVFPFYLNTASFLYQIRINFSFWRYQNALFILKWLGGQFCSGLLITLQKSHHQHRGKKVGPAVGTLLHMHMTQTHP